MKLKFIFPNQKPKSYATPRFTSAVICPFCEGIDWIDLTRIRSDEAFIRRHYKDFLCPTCGFKATFSTQHIHILKDPPVS